MVVSVGRGSDMVFRWWLGFGEIEGGAVMEGLVVIGDGGYGEGLGSGRRLRWLC